MDANNPFFDHIEKKAHVDKDQIYQIAHSVSDADFSDPEVVRQLIGRIGAAAGVNVPKDKEDALIKTITSGNLPSNFSSLSKMFGQNK
ncbi:MAG: stage VI sporulation protein F [Sporolactobacillus sp.]